MKKIISILLCMLLALSLLSSCGGTQSENNNENAQKKLSIVTTIFPVYDWVMEILGDTAESADVKMLIDTGVDFHSFQPTTADILSISEADVFAFVGGESDKWIGDILSSSENKTTVSVNLMEILGDKAKQEEDKEGMEPSQDEDDEETEYDEHIWLSLKNAQLLVPAIAEKLCLADEENAGAYRENAEKYAEKLSALDKEYEEKIGEAKLDTLVFADRFPFRYLTDDYGLDYFAAFSGCSAESEASFKTVSFLAEKIDEKGLGCVLTTEGTDHSIAEAVISSAKNGNAAILSVDSLQSVTKTDVENGAKYLDIMEKNLGVFLEALNSEA